MRFIFLYQSSSWFGFHPLPSALFIEFQKQDMMGAFDLCNKKKAVQKITFWTQRSEIEILASG